MKKILIVAMSLDGYIAQNRDQVSTAWTSSEDRRWFARRTKEIGTLIMGSKTFETIGRALPERVMVVMNEPGICEELTPLEQYDAAQKTAVYRTDGLSPRQLIEKLERLGIQQVAICGGARVYQSFLHDELVDELEITHESVLLGEGVKLTEGLDWVIRLERRGEERLSDQTVVGKYRV